MGARLLGERQGEWHTVWNRFAEAPAKYPRLPDLLRRSRPKGDGLYHDPSSWPQDNEAGEADLRAGLSTLKGMLPGAARDAIRALEVTHAPRRDWVWCELGYAPLAASLPALISLAETTETALIGATPDDMAKAYVAGAWKADAAALDALAIVEKPDDVDAVKAAVDTLYRPWLRTAAEAFQAAVKRHPLPASPPPGEARPPKPGRCYLFADGLRYDCSQKLAYTLAGMGLNVQSDWAYCALPSVTSTAKPAITPVAPCFGSGLELTPRVLEDNANVSAEIVRRELVKAGYEVLQGGDTGT